MFSERKKTKKAEGGSPSNLRGVFVFGEEAHLSPKVINCL